MPAVIKAPFVRSSNAPTQQSFDRPRTFKPRGGGNNYRPRAPKGPKKDAEILFQKFFKSVGPRTYAAQLKRAGNGNHFLVLTEGKRDEKTDEVKKTKLFIFSEDFDAFRDLLRDTFMFIKENPVSAEVAAKQKKFWAKKSRGDTPRPRPPERSSKSVRA